MIDMMDIQLTPAEEHADTRDLADVAKCIAGEAPTSSDIARYQHIVDQPAKSIGGVHTTRLRALRRAS